MASTTTEAVMNLINKIFVTILITYVFWFQYVFHEVSGVLPICGAILIFCNIFTLQKSVLKITRSSYLGIMIVILIIIAVSLVVTEHKDFSSEITKNLIEYVVVAAALYLFIIDNKENLTFTLSLICIVITALAISNIIQGTESYIGAVGIEGLNTNLMSSTFFLGFYSIFMLFHRKQGIPKFILIVCLAIIGFAQIMAASRRGFIVLLLFTALYLIYAAFIINNRSMSAKDILSGMIITLILIIAAIVLMNYVMNHTVLGLRLSGQFDSGDIARDYLKQNAIELFKEHPFAGVGINGFAYFNYEHLYTHSFFYELLSCTGLCGTLSMLIYIYVLIKKFWKAGSSRTIDQKCLQVNEISSLRINFIFIICILITGLAVVMWYDFYFYIFIALIAASYDEIKEPRES